VEIWRLVPIIKALEPNALRQIVAEKRAVLSPNSPEWSIRFGPGWFERLSVGIIDNGKKVGKYVQFHLIREGETTPDFNIYLFAMQNYGAWRERTNPGLTRYDPDLGIYAAEVDYSQFGPHPVIQPYYLKATYPTRKEIEEALDTEALSNYGAEIRLSIAYAVWEVRPEPFIKALAKILLPTQLREILEKIPVPATIRRG